MFRLWAFEVIHSRSLCTWALRIIETCIICIPGVWGLNTLIRTFDFEIDIFPGGAVIPAIFYTLLHAYMNVYSSCRVAMTAYP